jgi:hypothetical protein
LRDFVMALSHGLSLGEVGVSFQGARSWTLLEHPRLKSKTSGHGFVLLFDSFLSERHLVRERCVFAPIPIYWNDQLVAKKAEPWAGGPRLLERVERGAGVGHYLADWPRARNADRQAPLLPADGLYWRQFVDERGESLRKPDQTFFWMPAAAILSLPYAMSGLSRLHPVRYGVTLAPVNLQLDFGAQVVLNGDHLPVDLSGLQAREGAELDELKLRSARVIVEGATRLLRDLPGSMNLDVKGGNPFLVLLRVGSACAGCALLSYGQIWGAIGFLGFAISKRGDPMEDAFERNREAEELMRTRTRLGLMRKIPCS